MTHKAAVLASTYLEHRGMTLPKQDRLATLVCFLDTLFCVLGTFLFFLDTLFCFLDTLFCLLDTLSCCLDTLFFFLDKLFELTHKAAVFASTSLEHRGITPPNNQP